MLAIHPGLLNEDLEQILTSNGGCAKTFLRKFFIIFEITVKAILHNNIKKAVVCIPHTSFWSHLKAKTL